jgi:hypothetical protein
MEGAHAAAACRAAGAICRRSSRAAAARAGAAAPAGGSARGAKAEWVALRAAAAGGNPWFKHLYTASALFADASANLGDMLAHPAVAVPSGRSLGGLFELTVRRRRAARRGRGGGRRRGVGRGGGGRRAAGAHLASQI